MYLMNKSLKQAFTLIELLVVIAIVGILSGLIVVSMGGITQKATIAKAQVFSNSLRNSLMLNLVSEYKLDVDGSDSWGKNNGTINGATIVSGCVVDSCFNSAAGAVSNVSILDSQSIDSVWNAGHVFTLEAWIYSTFYNSDYQGIINKRTSDYYSASPGGLFINIDGNTLMFLIGTGVDAQTSTILSYAINNIHDRWLHVVGTSNGANLRLYVNGILVSNPVSFTQNPPVNNEPATIGSFYAGSRPFKGKIDNVRLYSAAITSSQVKEQYYSGLNSMLAGGNMTKEEYNARLSEMALR